MISQENRDKFLADLTTLTLKHKIAIGGCGCCGSPYLVELGGYLKEKGAYTIDHDEYLRWPEKEI
jgi:hypothetical protein